MATTRKSAKQSAPTKAPHPPLSERGRMLSADDVLELLPRKANGKPAKSRYRVLTQFLPEFKHRLGRTPYWWSTDVERSLDAANEESAA